MFERFLSHTPDLTDIVSIINTYDHIVFLGTGGSSLVGQALKAISSHAEHVIFFDNIDPRTFREKILPLTEKNTFFIIISKSGNTSETLTQTLSLEPYLSDNVLIITEKKESALMDLAHIHHWRIIEHPSDIGGRFSAFTINGLLPCLLFKLSAEKFIQGARKAITDQNHIKENIKQVFSYYPTNKMILMSYSDYTHPLLLWMSQLIAESLGKFDNDYTPQGIMPFIAKGTCDQHSQLQLWLDGPKDQSFQLFFFNDPIDTSKLNVDFKLQNDALRQLHSRSYSDIFRAHYLATATALQKAGYHVQLKEFLVLDEETVGYLMMEKIIEVFHLAELLNVSAEGQPGVEKAKNLVGVYL